RNVLELEHQWPYVVREVLLIRLVDRLEEDIGIEEVRIGLPSTGLVHGLAEGVHRHLVPHLADTGKAWREVLGVAPEDALFRGRVIAGIDADRAEEGEGGVLPKHPGRGALGSVIPVVDDAAPSGIIPGRST